MRTDRESLGDEDLALRFLAWMVGAVIVGGLLAKAFVRLERGRRDRDVIVVASEPPDIGTAGAIDLPVATAGPLATLTGADREIAGALIRMFGAKEYVQALDRAEGLLASPQTSDALRRWVEGELPTLRVSVGWLHLQEQDCERAIPFLLEAYRGGRRSEGAKGLGYCYAKTSQWHLADAYLLEALTLNQGDRSLHVVYADLLESLQRLDEGSRHLEQAAALATDVQERESLSQRARTMAARSRLARSQETFQSSAFHVTYRPEDLGAALDRVLAQLQDALYENETALGLRPPVGPIEVTLFPKSVTAQVAPDLPHWSAGVFDGRIRVPIPSEGPGSVRLERLLRVLRHELVHALTAPLLVGRLLPSWIGEGMAQYMECSDSGRARCLADAWRAADFRGARPSLLPFDSLDRSFLTLDHDAAQLAYAQSVFVVQVLERDFLGEGQLYRLTSAIARRDWRSGDSASLLDTLGVRAADLYQRAADRWLSGPY